jgi:hypothetical protein
MLEAKRKEIGRVRSVRQRTASVNGTIPRDSSVSGPLLRHATSLSKMNLEGASSSPVNPLGAVDGIRTSHRKVENTIPTRVVMFGSRLERWARDPCLGLTLFLVTEVSASSQSISNEDVCWSAIFLKHCEHINVQISLF